MPNSIFKELISALEQGVPCALGIISKGYASRRQGAKLVVFEDGRAVGLMGGGCPEEIRKRALEAIRTREATQFELDLNQEFGSDEGLMCGGKVSCLLLPNPTAALPVFRELAKRDAARTLGVAADYSLRICDETATGFIYRETVLPPEQLWIAGAGEIARAVATLAESVDFRVTVFDERREMVERKPFQESTSIRTGNWDEMLTEKLPAEPTLGLIATGVHQSDARVLSKWVKMPFAFLGMIGSRRKRQTIFEQFISEGVASKEQLERVACPAGLPIGDVTVQEIALSIVAQLVQNRSERRISQLAARNIKSPSLIKARAS